MLWHTLGRFIRGYRSTDKADLLGQIDAIHKSQALITTSVAQVEGGAVHVQSAGGTMEGIVASSRRVTEIMGQVVEVSLAQSAKLAGVTEDLTETRVEATARLRAA